MLSPDRDRAAATGARATAALRLALPLAGMAFFALAM